MGIYMQLTNKIKSKIMKITKLNSLITFFLLFFFISAYSQSEISKTQNHLVKSSSDATAWKFKTNGAVYASPVINEGIIYIGSLDSTFYAIEAKTGVPKWSNKSTNKILSTAIVHQNYVYFESDNKLIALSLKGELKWQYQLSADSVTNRIDPWDFHHSSPIIYKGIVYIGSEKGWIFGVDAKNGEVKFKCQTTAKEAIRTTPLIYGNKILFGDWDGNMYAYDLEKGNEAWVYDTKKDATYGWKNSIHEQPQIFENSVIFAGRSSRLYSLNAETGKRNWMYSSPTDQWLVGGPTVSNGVIFLGSSDQNLIRAFDADSGKLKWQTKLDCRIWGSAFIKNDELIIGSNSLFIIDKNSGKIKVQYTFEKVHEDKKYGKYVDRTANIHSSQLYYEGKIIFGSDDGYLYAIEEKN